MVAVNAAESTAMVLNGSGTNGFERDLLAEGRFQPGFGLEPLRASNLALSPLTAGAKLVLADSLRPLHI
jgi:hypothetical protein